MPEHPDLQVDFQPELRDPILVMSWAGWNDAGEAASTAARYIVAQTGAEPFARIDAEDYYDFTEARPLARYQEGERQIVWPTTDFYAVPNAGGVRDLILGIGIEPHHRWKSYLRALNELIRVEKVGLVLTMAGVAGGVPHTHPVRVSGSANNAELAQRYQMFPSRYEGPTGIVGVFHDDCRRHAIGGVSLWAAVPHYVPGLANPAGAASLLEAVARMTDFHVDDGPLRSQIERFNRQIDAALEENEDLREYVQRLEQAVGGPAAAMEPGGELPSADALIQDLEAFLRERQDDDS